MHLCEYLWKCQPPGNCLWRTQIYLSGFLEHSFKIIARWDWDFIAGPLYFTALLKWFNYQLLEVIIHAPNLKGAFKKTQLNPRYAFNAKEKSSTCYLYPLNLLLPLQISHGVEPPFYSFFFFFNGHCVLQVVLMAVVLPRGWWAVWHHKWCCSGDTGWLLTAHTPPG